MVITYGRTERPHMRVGSRMGSDMAKGNGLPGRPSIAVGTWKGSSRVTGSCTSPVAISTREILLKTCVRDMARSSGRMDRSIRVIGRKGSRTGRERYTYQVARSLVASSRTAF